MKRHPPSTQQHRCRCLPHHSMSLKLNGKKKSFSTWLNYKKKNFFCDIFAEHHERYYLYLIISVTVGVLLCLIIITGRIIIQKQRDDVEDRGKDEPKFHKSSTGETTITKGFSGDNISEVEGGDIDLTTPIAISNLPSKCEVCTVLVPFFITTFVLFRSIAIVAHNKLLLFCYATAIHTYLSSPICLIYSHFFFPPSLFSFFVIFISSYRNRHSTRIQILLLRHMSASFRQVQRVDY